MIRVHLELDEFTWYICPATLHIRQIVVTTMMARIPSSPRDHARMIRYLEKSV